jgi:hypothetical protein
MRKLNKIIRLSTKFNDWYLKNKTHKYNSTSNRFYYDILYELLIVQDGLCAYTEYRLIEDKLLEKIKNGFKVGKFSIDFFPQIPAQIEHFSKKKKQTSAWDWDNLFAVFNDVNLQKNHLENQFGIDDILKPDTLNYDPFEYLMYDSALHIFFPHSKLKKTIYDRVFNMIIVLGLNNDFIKMQRREYLNSIKAIQYFTDKTQSVDQFFTAYSMM